MPDDKELEEVTAEDVIQVLAREQATWHQCDATPANCGMGVACGCREDAVRMFKALRAADFIFLRKSNG